MKRIVLLTAIMAMCVRMSAQQLNATYLAYIDEWKKTALENQKDYGIPASIIMAQALLESGAGTSELAKKAKNHFGIKCTNEWMGGVYYYNDERGGECFRQYGNAAESFKDHALFLQRPRYASCFEIAIEDYEGWAHRLKECGYATDKLYPQKLIKLIETYGLDKLQADKSVSSSGGSASGGQPKRPLKAEVVRKSEPIMVIHNDPEPPYVEPLTAKQERDSFFLSHPKKKCNGLTYVVARADDTYANVAFRLNVRERELREDNDALGRDLREGDRIYLSPKKTAGATAYVWSHVGLSVWQLSQDEGMQLSAIQKLNGLDPSINVFRTRQRIYLRKVKEENGIY